MTAIFADTHTVEVMASYWMGGQTNYEMPKHNALNKFIVPMGSQFKLNVNNVVFLFVFESFKMLVKCTSMIRK